MRVGEGGGGVWGVGREGKLGERRRGGWLMKRMSLEPEINFAK